MRGTSAAAAAIVLACVLAGTARAAAITSAGSGNWNSTTPNAPWPGGLIPGAADTVTIANTHTVSLTDNRAVNGVIVNSGGTFSLGSSTLNNTGTFNNSGTFNGNTGLMRLSGTWTCSGTFNTGTSTIEYVGSGGTGVGDQIFLTNDNTFFNLTISNTTANNQVSLPNAFNINITGTMTISAGATFNLLNGNSSNVTINTTTPQGALTGAGILKTNRTLQTTAARFSTYNIASMTVHALGSGAGAMTIDASSAVGTYGALVTAGGNATVLSLGGDITVAGDITLSSGNQILDATASNFNITLGGNWINSSGNGANAFVARNGTVTFNGPNIQSMSAGSSVTNFFNVTMNKSGGWLNAATPATPAIGNTLTMTSNADILYFKGFDWTIPQLNGAGGLIATDGDLATLRTITIGSAANLNSVFNGVIADRNSGSGSIKLIKTGTGSLTLGGLNTYSGSTTVSTACTVLLGTNNALPNTTALNLSVTGVTLDMNGFNCAIGSLAGAAGSVVDNNGGAAGTYTLTTGSDSTTTTFAGVIKNTAQNVGLTKVGAGLMSLTGVNTHTGPTAVNGSRMTLSGSGSLVASPVMLSAGGQLLLDNSGTKVADRISDTLPLNFNGGELAYTGNTTGANLETVGPLVLSSGSNVVTVTPNGTQTFVTFASCARSPGATVLFRGTALGNTPGSGVANITFSDPSGLSLIGANTNLTNKPIIPFAFGDISVATTGVTGGFVTYNVNLADNGASTNGIRPMTSATEYSSTLATGANVKLTADIGSLGLSVNSLHFAGNGITSGGAVVTVTSGMIASSAAAAVTLVDASSKLSFAREGVVYLVGNNSGATTVAGTLAGTSGVTLVRTVNSGTFSLNTANPNLSGRWTINGTLAPTISSLAALQIPSDNVLGTTTPADTIGLSGGIVLASANLSTQRAVILGSGGGVLYASLGTTLTCNGVISSAAGAVNSDLFFANTGGTVQLSAANTYSGSTSLNAAATLKLGVANALPANSTLNLNFSGAKFDLNGFSPSLGGLAGVTGSIIDNSNSTPGTYTFTVGGNNQSTDFAGVIQNTSQTIALSKIGTGRLQFSGASANTYTGLTTVNGGTLRLARSGNVNNFAGNLTVNNGGTVQLAATEQMPNSTDVVVNSGGTLDMGSLNETVRSLTLNTGANIVTTAACTLNIGDGSNVSNLTMQGGTSTPALLTLSLGNASGNVTFDATNNGTATINGTLNLSSAASGARTFTINDGSAAVDMSIAGIIANGANTQGLTKAGAGTLRLSGANTFSGALTLSGGTLLATGSAAALGAGALTLNTAGTTLELDNDTPLNFNRTTTVSANVTIKSGRLTPGPAVTHSLGQLNIGTAQLSLQPSGNVANTDFGLSFATSATFTGNPTFDVANNGTGLGTLTLGALTGNITTAFTISKQGAGTLALNTGATSLIDGTIVNINGGTLNSNLIAALGTLAVVNIADGATFGIGATQQVGALNDAAGVAAHTGTVSSLANSGTNGSFTLTIGNNSNNRSSSYSGVFSDGGGILNLTKDGSGTLTLSGTSTYSGTTTVATGVLNVRSAGALGSTAGGTTVNNAAALQIQGGITLAEPLTLNGFGINSDGALRSLSDGNTLSGTVALGTQSVRINSDSGTLNFTQSITATNIALTLGGAGNGVVNGAVATGAGALIKDGAGIWTLNGANTYSNSTTINAGTLYFNGVGTGASAITINKGGAMGGIGTVAGTVTVASSAALMPGTGNLPVGAEALTINGQLTFNPGSILKCYIGPSNSTKIINNRNGSGSDDVSLSTGSPVNLELATTGIVAGSTFTVVSATGASGNVNGTLGRIALGLAVPNCKTTITATPTTTFPGAITVSPVSYAAQSLTWIDGAIGNHNWSDPNNWKVTGGAAPAGPPADGDTIIFDPGIPGNSSLLDYSVPIASLTLKGVPTTAPLTISAANSARLAIGAGGLTSNPGNATSYTITAPIYLATAQTWSVASTGPLTASGTFDGPLNASLTKTGTGTLVLSSGNNYAGLTTINGGTLQAANGNALGATTLGTIVASGATLDCSVAGGYPEPLFLNGDGINGASGALNISQTGAGNTTQDGMITLQSASTIRTQAGASGLAIRAGINNAGFTLTFDCASPAQLNTQPLSGSGDLVKNGGDQLTMFNANTYTGTTYVNAGRLAMAGNVIEILGDVYVGNGIGAPTSAILSNTTGSNSIASTATIYLDKTTGQYLENFDQTLSAIIDNPRPGAGSGPGSVIQLAGNLFFTGSNSGTLSAKITGTGKFKRNGSGVTTLTSTLSNYTGEIHANGSAGCTINVRTPQALGAAAVFVFKPCQLQLQDCGVITGPTALNLNQSGAGTAGMLQNVSGDNTWPTTLTLSNTPAGPTIDVAAGNLTLSNAAATSGTVGLQFTGSGNLTINGAIATGNNTVTKDGSGTLTLLGTNTYTGATNINGGVLRGKGTSGSAIVVGAGALFPGTAPVILTPATYADIGTGHVLSGASISFAAASKLKFIVTSDGAAAHSTNVSVTGAAAVTAGAALDFAVSSMNAFPAGDIPILSTNTAAPSIANTFVLAKPLPAGWSVVYKQAAGEVDAGGVPAASQAISPFAHTVVIRTNGSVTPVTIDSFTAKSSAGGVLLEWNCTSEFQNAGFNIYRGTSESSEWTRVNPALIPGRITNPDSKKYSLVDWSPPGEFIYKLESIDIAGRAETYAQLAGPVIADEHSAFNIESLDAAQQSVTLEINAKRAAEISFASKTGSTPQPAERSLSSLRSLESLPSLKSTVINPVHPASIRWFSNANASTSASFSATKITYDKSGVLLIPQSALGAGFDINHLSIQREGRQISALAVLPNGLLVYAPGYQDEYTDKDALFLRRIAGATPAGQFRNATNLFDSTQPVTATTPATASAEFHDVYFDYVYRPYTMTPWFSNKYLSAGTSQNFALNVAAPSAATAMLTLNLWSLTPGDHALQVLVNGQPTGSAQSWSGGNRVMQLSVELAANTLHAGENQIELTTPALNAGDAQLSFLHSIQLSYTRLLDGAVPFEIVNDGNTAKLFEIQNLPNATTWVVDARFSDRATLVPVQSQLDANGTYCLRFVAGSGGSGRFLIVPSGQENAPLSSSVRQVKPLRAGASYLATGPSRFSAGIQPLLMQRSKEGLRTQFADQEQLFDFYNFGRFGPAGIQSAVRATRPQYLLLLGRTTYDYRNYSGASVDPLCPAFLVSTTFWSQATSDSQFGDFGRGVPEVAVGRLPANNEAELSAAVNHVLDAKNLPQSGVRIHAVGDEIDPQAANFGGQLSSLKQSHPDFTWQLNVLGDTHSSAFEVTADMTAAANGGADLILYHGHGNAVRLGRTDPRILDTDSVQSWRGSVVFLQSTCTANWMAKNEAGFKSIAIQALTQPQGGISASIGSSTYMNPFAGMEFMSTLLSQTQSSQRWGIALLRAQQWAAAKGGGFYNDLSHTEQIFGDPAMPIFESHRPLKSSSNGTF